MIGNVRIVRKLLINGANRSLRDINGRTPLELAEEFQQKNIANIIKE